MNLENVVDVSSFLLFEATGDSEGDCNTIKGGGDDKIGQDIAMADDDDAESCIFDLSDFPRMNLENVVDVSSFLLFEATGDSEGDCNTIKGGGDDKIGQDIAMADDDDAESCIFDLSDFPRVSEVDDSDIQPCVHDDDDGDDDDDDDDDEEEDEDEDEDEEDMPGSSSTKTIQGFALGDQITFFGALFLFNNQDSVVAWEEDDCKAINMVETSYSVL
ncbi:replicase polyprotein 1ab [Quercus suber]|uniref:Replicase polyprotein 1ab n=1 Tax=Quercus suber TaxID=58331 RepID=A0AAW0L004_QUESU